MSMMQPRWPFSPYRRGLRALRLIHGAEVERSSVGEGVSATSAPPSPTTSESPFPGCRATPPEAVSAGCQWGATASARAGSVAPGAPGPAGTPVKTCLCGHAFQSHDNNGTGACLIPLCGCLFPRDKGWW